MLKDLHDLFAKSKNILEINHETEEIKNKIEKLKNSRKSSEDAILCQLKQYEGRLVEVERLLHDIHPNVQFAIFKNKNNEVLYRIEKDAVASAENEDENELRTKFKVFKRYNNLITYEDGTYFYFLLENENMKGNQADVINTENLSKSKGVFRIKSKFSRTLYNVLLSNAKKEMKNLSEELSRFNEYFVDTPFYKKNIDELKKKVLVTEVVKISKRSKRTEMVNLGAIISTDLKDFLDALMIMENLINIDDIKIMKFVKQAIADFFDDKRSKTMHEKILAFSDAIYFTQQYKRDFYDANGLKEDVFSNIVKSEVVSFQQSNLEHFLNDLKRDILVFNEAVDEIFQGHWNDTLKEIYNDKLCESFVGYVLSFDTISEFDALNLTKISKFLVKQGVSKLANLDALFISRKKNNLRIDDDEADMIIQKLSFN
ncbi:hypothetical protein THOM_1777 [Trachipleistophora hominis]|uniref:Uncharacterized protein n=1 Tax=Trachipleistophora hominis TaxID=72359 RepID=L7JVF3_TRAHO|nr:hypothetical protein THOM_1777 [Trachipleistophora hominis]